MKNTLLFVLLVLSFQTKAQTVEASTTIPINDYLDLLATNLEIPEEVSKKYENRSIEITFILTITKTGSVFNPKIQNDSLQLESNLKKAIEKLPKWNPKTEDGVAVVSRKAFNLSISIQKIENNITKKATPVGGIKNFYRQFIRKFNAPYEINQDEIKMRVGLSIKKDGSIINIIILESNEPDLNNEVIRVLKTMPNWEPALENGVPIDTFHVIPIIIKIRTHKDLDYYKKQFQQ